MKTSLTSPEGSDLLFLCMCGVKDSKHGSFPLDALSCSNKSKGSCRDALLHRWRSCSNEESASMASSELVSPFDITRAAGQKVEEWFSREEMV